MGLNIGSTSISDVKIGTTSVSEVYIGTTQVWSGSPAPSYTGFYVEDDSGSANTISLVKNDASAPTLTIETSSDGQNWSTLGQTSTTALDIQVPANGKVYVRCNTNTWCQRINNVNAANIFSSTSAFKVGGNIMSLLYGSNFTGNETTFPTVDERVFQNMFNGCTTLTNSQYLTLPATTLNERCYQDMFHGCTNLLNTPALPATTLAARCYNYMFMGCTSLTTAPALPATTLTTYCYQTMFSGCTSLTTAPDLPATTLADGCYQEMFRNCTNLSNVTCLATNISASNCTTNWLQNVAASGIFVKSDNMSSWTTGVNGIPSGWTVVNDPSTYDYTEPFYFEDLSGNANTIYLVAPNAGGVYPSGCSGSDVYVSTDNVNWSSVGQIAYDTIEIPVAANGKTYVKIEATAYSDGTNYACFTNADDEFAVGGNINSLIYGLNFTGNETVQMRHYVFQHFFEGNPWLVDASKLLLPIYGVHAASFMFYGCYGLQYAPEWLPSTMTGFTCQSMFEGCTSLTAVPVLFAETLSTYCYNAMFSGCSSVNKIICLAKDISAPACTTNWVNGVAASGTFYGSSTASWTRGNNGIPNIWGVVNI